MFADAPIRWTDPTTWPWMFYVWAAFALAGLAKPAWNWFRRQRAGGWPIAEGHIESVEVNKPTSSFTTKRGYYVAELGYSYSVAGTSHSGRYKREFPTEHEAEEFVRDLKGKPVAVHCNSALPVLHCSNPILRFCCKTVLQARLRTFPRRRTPFQIGLSRSSGSLCGCQPLDLWLACGFTLERSWDAPFRRRSWFSTSAPSLCGFHRYSLRKGWLVTLGAQTSGRSS